MRQPGSLISDALLVGDMKSMGGLLDHGNCEYKHREPSVIIPAQSRVPALQTGKSVRLA
jgi:hypothetical protein